MVIFEENLTHYFSRCCFPCCTNHIVCYYIVKDGSEVQRDPRRYLQTVQKVIAFMTLGIDMSKLFSEMIMVRLCMLLL